MPTSPPGVTEPGGGRSQPSVRHTRQRRALVIGLAVAGAAAALSGLTPLPVPALAALVVVGVAPLGPGLAERLVTTIGIVLAVTAPLAWLSSRSGLPLLRLGACAAVGWVAWALVARPSRAAPRRSEAVVIGAVAVGSVPLAWPLLTLRDPATALQRLLVGWDHASHFSMFLDARWSSGTAPLSAAASPDGSGWALGNYPVWWHGTLAGLAELWWGGPAEVPGEVLRYAQLQGVMFILTNVLGAAVVTWGLRTATRPVRVFGVTAAGCLLLGLPGATNLVFAHAAFSLAVVATAAVVVVLARTSSLTTPRVGALVGLSAAVASWPLLIPLAIGGATPPVVRLWRSGGPQRLLLGSGLAATAVLAVPSVVSSAGGSVGRHLNETGGVLQVGLFTALAAPLVCIALAVLRRADPALGIFGGSALVLLLAIGAWQLATAGSLEYYFWKVALATFSCTLLVAPALTSSTRGAGAVGLRPRTGGTARSGALLSAAALAAGIVVTGGLAPVAAFVGAPGLLAEGAGSVAAAGCLLEAAEGPARSSAAATTLVWPGDSKVDPRLADQWFHSLTMSRTRAAEEAGAQLEGVGSEELRARLRDSGRKILAFDRAPCAGPS